MFRAREVMMVMASPTPPPSVAAIHPYSHPFGKGKHVRNATASVCVCVSFPFFLLSTMCVRNNCKEHKGVHVQRTTTTTTITTDHDDDAVYPWRCAYATRVRTRAPSNRMTLCVRVCCTHTGIVFVTHKRTQRTNAHALHFTGRPAACGVEY